VDHYRRFAARADAASVPTEGSLGLLVERLDPERDGEGDGVRAPRLLVATRILDAVTDAREGITCQRIVTEVRLEDVERSGKLFRGDRGKDRVVSDEMPPLRAPPSERRPAARCWGMGFRRTVGPGRRPRARTGTMGRPQERGGRGHGVARAVSRP